jgi:hypothetical protein
MEIIQSQSLAFLFERVIFQRDPFQIYSTNITGRSICQEVCEFVGVSFDMRRDDGRSTLVNELKLLKTLL